MAVAGIGEGALIIGLGRYGGVEFEIEACLDDQPAVAFKGAGTGKGTARHGGRRGGGDDAVIADTSISGGLVARELDDLVRLYGKPGTIASKNGTERTNYGTNKNGLLGKPAVIFHIVHFQSEKCLPSLFVEPGFLLLSIPAT